MAHAPLVTAVPQDPVTLFAPAVQTVTASGDSGPLNIASITSGIASVYVAGATGTTPSMTVYFDVQDAGGLWLTVATIGVALTNGPNYTFGNFGPVAGAGYVLTGTGRLRWVVTGTTPSFTGVQFSVIGR